MTSIRQIRTIHEQSTICITLYADMDRNIEDGLAGWPTQTPGAGPATSVGPSECPNRNCDRTMPCELHEGEREARGDRALNDRTRFNQAAREATKHLQAMADIASYWAIPRMDGTAVKARLEDVMDALWCSNCAKHGHRNVNLGDRDVCGFCSKIRGKYNMLPPKDLLDIHVTRGKVYPTDIARCLDRERLRLRTERQTAKTDKKAS